MQNNVSMFICGDTPHPLSQNEEEVMKKNKEKGCSIRIIINYKSKTEQERIINVTNAVKSLIREEIKKAG